MNLLKSALSVITGIIPMQKTIIKTYELHGVNGFATHQVVSEVEVYAHIQPISPVEYKKLTNSTIDSVECYKLYYTDNNAQIIHSLDHPIEQSVIEWNGRMLKAYAKRDWYKQNGWIAIYVTITENEELEC